MDERPAGQTGGATFSGVVEVKISGLRKRGFSELSSLLYGANQFTVPFMGFAVIQSSLCCLQIYLYDYFDVDLVLPFRVHLPL